MQVLDKSASARSVAERKLTERLGEVLNWHPAIGLAVGVPATVVGFLLWTRCSPRTGLLEVVVAMQGAVRKARTNPVSTGPRVAWPQPPAAPRWMTLPFPKSVPLQ